MIVPSTVSDDEELGRCVVSKRAALRAREGRGVVKLLTPRRGDRRISVDRLSIAPLADAVANGRRVAAARQEGIIRTSGQPSRDVDFCGWITVAALAVRSADCECIASPIERPNSASNPYHADIVMPESVMDDDFERVRYAQELEESATWRKGP